MAETDYENNLIECDLYYGGTSVVIGHCVFGKYRPRLVPPRTDIGFICIHTCTGLSNLTANLQNYEGHVKWCKVKGDYVCGFNSRSLAKNGRATDHFVFTLFTKEPHSCGDSKNNYPTFRTACYNYLQEKLYTTTLFHTVDLHQTSHHQSLKSKPNKSQQIQHCNLTWMPLCI